MTTQILSANMLDFFSKISDQEFQTFEELKAIPSLKPLLKQEIEDFRDKHSTDPLAVSAADDLLVDLL